MQTGFLIAGILFFLNPNVEIIDVLPDFIGCALLLWGTRRICAYTERGSVAAKAFRWLLLVNLVKTVALLLFFVISEAEMTWMLLLTSVFGVLEAVLFLYGMHQLLEAVTFTAMLHGCDGVYGRAMSSFGSMVKLFTVIKCVFALLPELTYLATDYGTVTAFRTDWSFLFRLLTAVNIFVVSIFGILTLVLAVRFFRGLSKKESVYLAALREDYRREIEEKPGVLPYRRLRWTALLLFAGMAFLLPLRLDGVDVLPDFAAAGLLIAAVLLLRQEFPKAVRQCVIFLSVFGVLSVIEWIGDLLLLLSTHYSILNADLYISYATYLSQYLYRDPDAYYHFLLLLLLTALRCIALIPSMLFVYRLLRALVLAHTGAPETREDDAYLVESAARKTEAIHRRMSGFLRGLSVLAVLYAVGSFLSKALLLQKLPFPTWMPEFLLGLLAAVLCRIFTYALADNMDRKYYYSEHI